MKKSFAWLPILIVFLCAAVIGAGSYYYIYKIYLPKISKPTPAEVEKPTTEKPTTPTETKKAITWITPEKIPSLQLFWLKIRPEGGRYLKIGKINEGKYEGGEIVLAFTQPAGPGFSDDLYRLIRKDGKLYLLTKYSTKLYEEDGVDRSMFTQDDSFTIPDLEFPSTIVYNQITLTLDLNEVNVLFDATGLKKLFSDSKVGDVYTNQSLEDENAWYRIMKNCFFVKAPDGTAKFYKYLLPFVDEKGIPRITWQNGQENSFAYTYRGRHACGFEVCLDVVSISSGELKVVGKTKGGETVYEYKDSNNQALKDIYEKDYILPEGESKMSYDNFIASHPVFFWKESFGRWVRFLNNTFLPPTECGKPVIYLYPEKPSLVSVKINPLGGIRLSDPLYQNGWWVLAFPNGHLIDLTSGKICSYLFWEGNSDIYKMPEQGFVVEKKELNQFLSTKLKELGLIEKEATEFMEFWIPRILEKDTPYYFITFISQSEINRMVPLEVSPAPETVIRILMDYRPLDQYIQVPGFQIVIPQRKGFTVVEWGGVLH